MVLLMGHQYSALRRNSMACVAFPTCGMAMAESERYLPALMDKIEPMLEEAGLQRQRNRHSHDRLSEWMRKTDAWLKLRLSVRRQANTICIWAAALPDNA